MALNVNTKVQDSFYRYKMPPIIAKVEGKGNGIKTVIVNMVDVARALLRPPTYVTKYFGCELGAQTQFDIKAERYIVNGCHDQRKLQDMLDGFIKKFVLCEKCENPETVIKVKKNLVGASCRACGAASEYSSLGTRAWPSRLLEGADRPARRRTGLRRPR